MEHRQGVVIDIFSTVSNNGGYQDGVDPKPPKKKRSPMHILRVANYMLSLKSGKSKTAHTDVVSKWKKLLSSMRPLHINNSQSTQRSITDAVPMATLTSKEVYAPSAASEDVEQLEALTPPWSPAPKSTAGSSSGVKEMSEAIKYLKPGLFAYMHVSSKRKGQKQEYIALDEGSRHAISDDRAENARCSPEFS
ncbi:hypothetical protein SADUNF_Sadunf14G0091900 [Salix dunnii]|uniref:Uncharacterized protein n=1 Tax=Salix dunnii TaxID=1413687 RepID=A0A835JH86_9ROSI|nr:hypothetical protein SADUNF_Sadunf14G0091900 [Salix dunnii]